MTQHFYRRLDDDEHASQFANGTMLLSTFKHLRHPHHPRSDLRDGTTDWRHSRVDGTRSEKDVADFIAGADAQGMFKVADGRLPADSTFYGNVVTHTVDAYVMCGSLVPGQGQFGKHCFKINDVQTFAGHVAKVLAALHGCRVGTAQEAVVYGRDRHGLIAPAHPFFAGTTGNEGEQEFRVVWMVDRPIEPIVVDVPGAAQFIERVT